MSRNREWAGVACVVISTVLLAISLLGLWRCCAERVSLASAKSHLQHGEPTKALEAVRETCFLLFQSEREVVSAEARQQQIQQIIEAAETPLAGGYPPDTAFQEPSACMPASSAAPTPPKDGGLGR